MFKLSGSDLLIHPELEIGYAQGDAVQGRLDLGEVGVFVSLHFTVLDDLQETVPAAGKLVHRVQGFHGDLGQFLGFGPQGVYLADRALIDAVVVAQGRRAVILSQQKGVLRLDLGAPVFNLLLPGSSAKWIYSP